MRSKLRVSAKSVRLLEELHCHVVRCDISGPLERFHDIASDCFDSMYFRTELDDLIRRRLLTVVRHGFDDSLGRDPMRDGDRRLCGVAWSVNPTRALVAGLWPGRLLAKETGK